MKRSKRKSKRSRIPFLGKFPFRRQGDSHKGDYGKVAVIAGSYGMAGAAALCANSCLKSGAGLLYLFTPASIYPVVASQCLCAVCHPVKDTTGQFPSSSTEEITYFCNSKADVVCIGPGIGVSDDLKKFVNALITQIDKPMILDADALNCLEISSLKKRAHATVITPHEGEFARLIGTDQSDVHGNRRKLATAFAGRHKVIVVLKGYNTIVTDGERVYINRTGNPGMATGGTGDCLTGVIGACLGLMSDTFEAACFAVYVHGLAGDIAARALGETSMTALDLMNYLPAAFMRLKKKSGGF